MRIAVAALLLALLAVPALLAWITYRSLRAIAAGMLLIILWALG